MYKGLYMLDRMHIYSQGLKSVTPMLSYDSLIFKRNEMYVREYTLSNSQNKQYLAALVGNELHLYNFVTNQLLFSHNMKSVLTLRNKGDSSPCLFFLDNDNLLAVRISTRTLSLISIAACCEVFSHKATALKSQEITMKIEKPFIHYSIEKGFGVTDEGGFAVEEDEDK